MQRSQISHSRWIRLAHVQSASPVTGGLSPETLSSLRRRRALYTLTTGILSALMFLGVTDTLGWTSAYGVSSAVVEVSSAGRTLRVRYPEVTRPALASPFDITVVDPDGFDEPVRLRLNRDFFQLWDENGWYPEPSSERSQGEWIEIEFDPPSGDELRVSFDARIEPAVQSGRAGEVALMDGTEAVVTARFDVAVRP